VEFGKPKSNSKGLIMKCQCGNHSDNIKSYFSKESQLRVTVCDECAVSNRLNDEKKYEIVPYKDLTEHQNKTPEPNANQ